MMIFGLNLLINDQINQYIKFHSKISILVGHSMKNRNERTSFKKSNRNNFLHRFKTQVRDSNSIQNLRISKINESNYKIYDTIKKSIKDTQILSTKTPLNISSQQFREFEAFHLGKSQSYANYDKQLRRQLMYNQQKQLSDSNQKCLRNNISNLQNYICQYKKIMKYESKKKLEQTQRIKQIITILIENANQLKCYRYQVEVDGILQLLGQIIKNILKSLNLEMENFKNKVTKATEIEKIRNSLIDNNLSSRLHYLEEKNGQQRLSLHDHKHQYAQFLSMSSFKIQNQSAHNHQYLTMYSLNQQTELKQKQQQQQKFQQKVPNMDEDIKLQKFYKTETNKSNRNQNIKPFFIKKQVNTQLQIQNKRKPQKSQLHNRNLAQTKQKKQQMTNDQLIFFENCKGLCQFFNCHQNEIVNEVEGSRSQSKRQVLNSIIIMLNSKYNRNIRFCRD